MQFFHKSKFTKLFKLQSWSFNLKHKNFKVSMKVYRINLLTKSQTSELRNTLKAWAKYIKETVLHIKGSVKIGFKSTWYLQVYDLGTKLNVSIWLFEIPDK